MASEDHTKRGGHSMLLERLYEYTVVPAEKTQTRLHYFYSPVNSGCTNFRKHMEFQDNEADVRGKTVTTKNWARIREHILSEDEERVRRFLKTIQDAKDPQTRNPRVQFKPSSI